MSEAELIRRWIALERGNGIERARRVSRYLDIGGFALFVAIIVSSIFLDLPSLILVLPAIVVGWLLAERNALNGRLAQWPTIRQYIDWEKIDRDYASQQSAVKTPPHDVAP